MGYNYSEVAVKHKIDTILLKIFDYLETTLSDIASMDQTISLSSNSQRDLDFRVKNNEGNFEYTLIYTEAFDMHMLFLFDDYKNKPRVKYTIDLTNLGTKQTYVDGENNTLFDVYEEIYKHLIMHWNEANKEYPYSVKDIFINYKDRKTNLEHLDNFQI